MEKKSVSNYEEMTLSNPFPNVLLPLISHLHLGTQAPWDQEIYSRAIDKVMSLPFTCSSMLLPHKQPAGQVGSTGEAAKLQEPLPWEQNL